MTAPDIGEEAPGKRLDVAHVTFHSLCQQLSRQEGSQRRHRETGSCIDFSTAE